MGSNVDLSTLANALSASPLFAGLGSDDLVRLPPKGLAHDHVRIKGIRVGGRGAIIRLPRLSQFGFDPATNLSYQAACFERASQSGHVPRLLEILKPSHVIPLGALVVEEVDGGPVRLPDDLNGMAECFARVHLLDVPSSSDRPPLVDQADPLLGLMSFVEEQALFIEASATDPASAQMLFEELDWARRFAAYKAGTHPPARLCLTDTHPGNFMADTRGKVHFIDLEKALYGSPAVDLGHATVLTSTLWDISVQTELNYEEVRAFYHTYLDLLPSVMADEIRPWLLPLRRLAWLRSTTWSCKWYAEHHRNQPAEMGLRARVQDHVARRLRLFVDVETILRVRAEWMSPDPLRLD